MTWAAETSPVRPVTGAAWNGELAVDNMLAANAVVLAMDRMMDAASAGTTHLLVVVILLGGESAPKQGHDPIMRHET
jgi:phosphosulfolactate phosphohydrolase-like enzyme